MRRVFQVLTFLLAGGCCPISAGPRTAGENAAGGFPPDCSQVVAVLAETWSDTGALLGRFERTGGHWRRVGEPVPATLGHRGLAVGLGLHPAGLEGPVKTEGDRRAPAGIFRLEFAFGTADSEIEAFPYRRSSAADRWIDDPASSHYNQWVNLADGSVASDWRSAEVMRRKDGLYDLGLVVGHNRNPVVRGRGSAIFMHIWSAPGRSTLGCTAMARRRLRELLSWLDQSKSPVLVQAPRPWISQLRLPAALAATLVEGLPTGR